MKQVWLANDGTVCETQEEAKKRDDADSLREEIEAFVRSLDAAPRRFSEYTRVLKAWVAR